MSVRVEHGRGHVRRGVDDVRGGWTLLHVLDGPDVWGTLGDIRSHVLQIFSG